MLMGFSGILMELFVSLMGCQFYFNGNELDFNGNVREFNGMFVECDGNECDVNAN